MTLPFKSYVPLWQAHQMVWASSLYWTVQFRWVQTAEKARHSVSPDRISSTGRLPNFTILPLFTLRS